jgi:hypothetical protein
MIHAHSFQHLSGRLARHEGLDAEGQKWMILMDLHSHSIEMKKHLVTQGMFTNKVFLHLCTHRCDNAKMFQEALIAQCTLNELMNNTRLVI